jgi:hypothetical protein
MLAIASAHYSHARLEAKRNALDAVSSRRSDHCKDGRETVGYDTNAAKQDVEYLQAIQKNGGVDGTRTRGLCRDRAAF